MLYEPCILCCTYLDCKSLGFIKKTFIQMISNFQWVREKRMSHQKRVHNLSEGYLHPWRMADYHCHLCCIRSVGTGHSDILPTYQLCLGRLYKEGVWEKCWWKKESGSLHHVYSAWICRKRQFQHKSICATPLQNPGIVIFCICQISCTITIDILLSCTNTSFFINWLAIIDSKLVRQPCQSMLAWDKTAYWR